MRLDTIDTIKDAVVKMSDGNPGAVVALMQMMIRGNKYGEVHGLRRLCILDECEIYGSKVWLLWKDVCNFDGERFDKMIDGGKKAILSEVKSNGGGYLLREFGLGDTECDAR